MITRDDLLKIQRIAVRKAADHFIENLSKLVKNKYLRNLAGSPHVHNTAIDLEDGNYLLVQFVVFFGKVITKEELEKLKKPPEKVDEVGIFVRCDSEGN